MALISKGLLALILALQPVSSQGLDNYPVPKDFEAKIAFYNVENLFDTWDDPDKEDDEFLPRGLRNWNEEKLQRKLVRIARVLVGMGGWEAPDLVGLCEVENLPVLEKLIHETPLAHWPYGVVHFDSPDKRGIDVALLYLRERFRVIKADRIPVIFNNDPMPQTRDILFVKGILCGACTLNIFVNHWPSRFGDYISTSIRRTAAAQALRKEVDSIRNLEEEAFVVIMGDFNDEPGDECLETLCRDGSGLVNLMGSMAPAKGTGTIKYQSQWFVFDQIIVSANLLHQKGKTHIIGGGAMIYNPDFLMVDDDKYFGRKPFRTYSGPAYLGGFSDHLPVFVNLKIKN